MPVLISRWQFAVTILFHFLFVPLTIGLALLVAIMQTLAYRHHDGEWDRLARFFGELFLINFALGVVTGIVQEFQFGMNWSNYSVFVGNIFGAPLAIEGLLAFFMESTFIGLWIFGRNRLSARLHLASIWLVSLGTILSALFILAANAWMQHPVGYRIVGHKALLTNFWALFENTTLWAEFSHTLLAAIITGAMFVLGVAAWHLLRLGRGAGAGGPGQGAPAVVPAAGATIGSPAASSDTTSALLAAASSSDPSAGDLLTGDASDHGRGAPGRALDESAPGDPARPYRRVARLAAAIALVATVLVITTGDIQARLMDVQQPMKMAAAEALYHTQSGASFSLLTIGNLSGQPIFQIRVPHLLSLIADLSYNGKVAGIDNVQRAEAAKYGPGSYVPIIWVTYWSFRLMVGLGGLLLVASAWALWLSRRRARYRLEQSRWTLWALVACIAAPFLANSFGWIFTEMGRQPWIVYGLMKTSAAVSPNLTTAAAALSLGGFTIVYSILGAIDASLMLRAARRGIAEAGAAVPGGGSPGAGSASGEPAPDALAAVGGSERETADALVY